MESLMHTDEEERSPATLPGQAMVFFMHVVLALGSWLALMMIGYALNPQGVPQIMILLLSILVPLVVGFLVTRLRQDELAPLVWLIGLIWILIVSLWVLDMPTGPNQCFQCDATEKLTRTFFSLPRPSGLIDNDGPFLGTWPAAALIGYAIGARLALRRRPPVE
jgi:energy-coupling factor transporter transmembrane protein EcfT